MAIFFYRLLVIFLTFQIFLQIPRFFEKLKILVSFRFLKQNIRKLLAIYLKNRLKNRQITKRKFLSLKILVNCPQKSPDLVTLIDKWQP